MVYCTWILDWNRHNPIVIFIVCLVNCWETKYDWHLVLLTLYSHVNNRQFLKIVFIFIRNIIEFFHEAVSKGNTTLFLKILYFYCGYENSTCVIHWLFTEILYCNNLMLSNVIRYYRTKDTAAVFSPSHK